MIKTVTTLNNCKYTGEVISEKEFSLVVKTKSKNILIPKYLIKSIEQ